MVQIQYLARSRSTLANKPNHYFIKNESIMSIYMFTDIDIRYTDAALAIFRRQIDRVIIIKLMTNLAQVKHHIDPFYLIDVDSNKRFDCASIVDIILNGPECSIYIIDAYIYDFIIGNHTRYDAILNEYDAIREEFNSRTCSPEQARDKIVLARNSIYSVKCRRREFIISLIMISEICERIVKAWGRIAPQ